MLFHRIQARPKIPKAELGLVWEQVQVRVQAPELELEQG
jgi:hypothetical protein